MDNFAMTNNNTCVSIPLMNSNCAYGALDNNGDFVCSSCNSGYYMNQFNQCSAIPLTATNCSTGTYNN